MRTPPTLSPLAFERFPINVLFKFKVAIATLLLAGCGKSDPATQCLESFKFDLRDPESGKVLAFSQPLLTYSATNAYGARIQGKALCKLNGDKWVRDRSAEYIEVINKSAEKLEKSNKCHASGVPQEKCDTESEVLRRSWRLSVEVDTNELHAETRRQLGYD